MIDYCKMNLLLLNKNDITESVKTKKYLKGLKKIKGKKDKTYIYFFTLGRVHTEQHL